MSADFGLLRPHIPDGLLPFPDLTRRPVDQRFVDARHRLDATPMTVLHALPLPPADVPSFLQHLDAHRDERSWMGA